MARLMQSLWSYLLDSAGDAAPAPADDVDASTVLSSSSSSSSPSSPAMLASLPSEVWLLVLQELSIQDVSHMAQTSVDFASLYASGSLSRCAHNAVWRPLTLSLYPEITKLESADLLEALSSSGGSWRRLCERIAAHGWSHRRLRVLKRDWKTQGERAIAVAAFAVPWYAVLVALHAWALPHAIATGALAVTALTHAFFSAVHVESTAPVVVRTSQTRYSLYVAHPPQPTQRRSGVLVRVTRALWSAELLLYAVGTLVSVPYWLWFARSPERRLLSAIVAAPVVVRLCGVTRVRSLHVLLVTAPLLALAKTQILE